MQKVFDISQDDDESDTSQEDLENSQEDSQEFEIDRPDFESWKRQPVPPNILHENQDFRFYLMDCDFGLIPTQSIRPGLIPFESPLTLPACYRLPTICKEQSYIRLHGINQSGNSVCCNVFGFLPYFYAVPSAELNLENIEKLKTTLITKLIETILSNINAVPYHDLVVNSPIVSIEIRDVKDFKNIYDFHQSSRRNDPSSIFNATNILKITCALPRFVWTAAKILKSDEITISGVKKPCRFDIYEAAINHNIRFLSDTNLSVCTWLELKGATYYIRSEDTKLSHAQIEVDVYYEDLTKVCPGEDLADIIPPIRVLSFDIECMTRPPNFIFPRDGADRVLQIGNVFATYGTSDTPRKVVFALGECQESEATEIMCFQDEGMMLEAWRLFVLASDPDILTGYNIRKFDIPYLIDRANHLRITSFPFLGRIRSSLSVVREIKPGPKQMYDYDVKKVTISGRIILDMFVLMMRHNTIPGKCSLAEVSIRYLKAERKIDLHHTKIFKMQNMGKSSRKELAEYCIQDCVLPYLLLQNHNPNPVKIPGGDMLSYYIGKARETGTPLKYLVAKSKEYCTYFRMVRTQKNPAIRFIPDTPRTPTPLKIKRRRSSDPSPVKLFPPRRLDFNSPSKEHFDQPSSAPWLRK